MSLTELMRNGTPFLRDAWKYTSKEAVIPDSFVHF
jgi:hypothetical protein